MINNDNDAKPKVYRRSSLKSKNLNIKINPNPNSPVKKNGKRTSISWGQIESFDFKEMKPTFQENEEVLKKQTEESDERHKKFIEQRRRSIQNEFIPEKQIIKMSENLIDEIFNEEMKLYIGEDNKDGNSSSKEKNKSRESSKSKSGSGSCSCSRCLRSGSYSSYCSSCRKSDKVSDKVKKDKKNKKNKNETLSDKDSQKSEDKKTKDKGLKSKGKKEDKDIDNQKIEKIKVKDKNIKIKENKEEKKEEKIINKKNVESPKEINKENKQKKEEEKMTNIRVKLISDSDAKVRLISYKEARELNLDTVAYIVLNDGSVLVVRREYKNKNENSFCDNPLNYSYNNLSYYSNGALNANYSNFTNINNLSRANIPNQANQVIKLPFKKLPFRQNTQNFFPKPNYIFNKPDYANNDPYFQIKNFNDKIPNKNNNNNNNNDIFKKNIKLSKNPNSPLFKMNKNTQSFKYFSPKINLKSAFLKSNYTQSQSRLKTNSPRKFIQISPQSIKDIDNFRVIEAIPVYNNNSQVMNNLQPNDEINDSREYSNKVVTNFSRYIKDKNQRKPNMVYSQMIFNDGENNYNYTDMN